MSNVPVYMVVNLAVTDVNEYRQYEKGFFPILKRFGGQFVTFDDNLGRCNCSLLFILGLVRWLWEQSFRAGSKPLYGLC